jgi:putative copper export protein
LLSVSTDTLRVFLHVVAATIWVGGQLTLGALVPALRGFDGVTTVAARRFSRIAWPAFVVLVLTGVWNMFSLHHPDGDYRMTLNVKLGFVVLSGVAAFLHARANSKRGMAIWGGLGGLSALLALFFGVQLGG